MTCCFRLGVFHLFSIQTTRCIGDRGRMILYQKNPPSSLLPVTYVPHASRHIQITSTFLCVLQSSLLPPVCSTLPLSDLILPCVATSFWTFLLPFYPLAPSLPQLYNDCHLALGYDQSFPIHNISFQRFPACSFQ